MKRRHTNAAQLDGVVDLERLRSGSPDSIERDAARFLDLTYPTDDVKALLRLLSRRFGGAASEGTILANAVKGLGKSHTLLLAYHLLKSPAEATAWMKQLGFPWTPPASAIVLVHKFTDRSMPGDALWSLVGRELGQTWGEERAPDVEHLIAALADRHLVLILDELERGIQGIVNEAKRIQNLNFLQMLSEAANRDQRITLIAAIYDGTVEPGATLRRTPKLELHFRKTEDRAAIVRHRLFANADTYDRNAARDLIRSYANIWKRFGVDTSEQQLARMEATFPFLPDLVELVFTRISDTGGFQGTRSALGLLGAMLDASPPDSYLMTAANCKISDNACADRLQDLNPSGDLIACATSNLRDLESKPYAEAIASATLLASLVPGGRSIGLSKEEMIRSVVKPGDDPNEFQATLDAFQKFGTYFHHSEGRYHFDREENAFAKVELAAARLSDDVARAQVITTWRQEVFRDTQETVVLQDLEQAKSDLDALGLRGRRFVLAPRRLSTEERHGLYLGAQMRNQIILLEPREAATSHLANPDLLAYAKRVKAANELANSPGNADARRRYEDIKLEESRQLQRLLKSAGLTYVRIENWAEVAIATQFEEEPFGQSSSKAEVIEQLRTHVYPPSLFVEHLRDHLAAFIGQRVEQVDRAYRSTLGFPVPLDVPTITSAVRQLAEDRARILGLKHQRNGGGFCGELVTLSESEFNQAELAHPWPAAMPPTTSGPGPVPPSEPGTPGPVPPGGAGPSPAAPPGVRSEDRSTPHCASLGELRQQVAARLVDVDAPVIQHVRFAIFADFRSHDLGSLPAAFRGGLSGTGDLGIQVDIAVPGPMTKAQLEQHCEKLPNLAGATYSARMVVELSDVISTAINNVTSEQNQS
ncbi:MAG: hypothetical protein WCR74_18810 [Betaproteobacteria bacterium]